MLLTKLWEENLLFETSIDNFMFSSVLEASKNYVSLNNKLKDELENLLKENASPELIVKLFNIFNADRLLNRLCWNLWESQFNNSSAYQKFISKVNKMPCFKSLFKEQIGIFLKDYRKRNVESNELVEIDSLLLSLKDTNENKIEKKLVKIKKNIKNDLELESKTKENILNDLTKKNDRILLNDYKKSFNDKNLCISDEEDLRTLLSDNSSREVRELLCKNANNINSVIEENINELIKTYFNISKSNGYSSILDYKLRDTNLTSEDVIKEMNEGYQSNIDKLNLIINKISLFSKVDGLKIDSLKKWDYLYYINKFNEKRKSYEKINNVFFDNKTVYKYIKYLLEDLFNFEVKYKIRKSKNNYYVEYIIVDTILNKKMILNIIEDKNNGSYFMPMVFDNSLIADNNFMRSLIVLEKSENFNIFNLKEIFHEIGHAMAFFFYKNKLDYENGKEAWEFIEIESTLMEKVILNSDILTYFKVNNKLISPKIIRKIKNHNLDDIFVRTQSFIMNSIIVNLISKDYPFTYQELKDKIEEVDILKMWATPNNRLLSESFKLYHWAEWIYPLNNQIAGKLFKKYSLSKKSKIKKNIRNIYIEYFSGNIREELNKL